MKLTKPTILQAVKTVSGCKMPTLEVVKMSSTQADPPVTFILQIVGVDFDKDATLLSTLKR